MSDCLKREILNSLWMCVLVCIACSSVHVWFWIDFWWYLEMVPDWHLAASNFNVNINQLSKIIAEGTRRTMHIAFNYCGCWHTRTRYLDCTVIYIVMVNASVDYRRYKFPCAQNPMNVDCRYSWNFTKTTHAMLNGRIRLSLRLLLPQCSWGLQYRH